MAVNLDVYDTLVHAIYDAAPASVALASGA